MSDDDLIQILEKQRSLMIAVATGGPRIDSVREEYREAYLAADAALRERNIENVNPYPDLWEWYGRWSSGDLPSYQSRRQFVSDIFNPLITQIRNRAAGRPSEALEEPTGWPKVDRTIGEIRKRLAEARTAEQFQAVGLLCRESLISLAQAVYNPLSHPTLDGVRASNTDAKRMLEAYIAAELPGSGNEVARKHARAGYELAVELQHRRTADFRQAALCAEATAAVVNAIAIISGVRDPQ
jgi:hypothetical protein